MRKWFVFDCITRYLSATGHGLEEEVALASIGGEGLNFAFCGFCGIGSIGV